jgi:hypothetical protein
VLPVLALIVGVVVIALVTRPAPRLPEWVPHTGPAGPVNLDSLVAHDSGFAVLSGVTSEGVQLWSSTHGSEWSSTPVPGAPSRLVARDGGLIAHNGAGGSVLVQSGGSWQVDEQVDFPDEMRTSQSPGRSSLVSGPGGIVMTSVDGEVWWSDLVEFVPSVPDPQWGPGQTVDVPFDSTCRPPTRTSPDVPPIVATGTGFVAMVSGDAQEPFGIWPVCEPTVWASPNGRTWTSSPAGLGDGAYVYNLAWRDGLFLAVGGLAIGEPAVWSSRDGTEWSRLNALDAGSGVDLFTVRAGGAGWVVLGQETESSRQVGWTSPDGACWVPLPTDVHAGDAGVSGTQVLLVDRVRYPETWVSTIADERSCR